MRYISHNKDKQSGYNMIYCDNDCHKQKIYHMSLEDIEAFKKCKDDKCRRKIINSNGPKIDLLEDC